LNDFGDSGANDAWIQQYETACTFVLNDSLQGNGAAERVAHIDDVIET
jgi:hypothetical protein